MGKYQSKIKNNLFLPATFSKQNAETTNTLSNITKIIGRSLWSFFLPSILSIADFSFYGSIQYFGSTLISSSNLGTQQVIMRATDKKLPFLGFILHSLILIVIQCFFIKLFFKNTSLIIIFYSFLFTFFTICYSNLTFLLKNYRSFQNTLYIEIFGTSLFGISIIILYFFPSTRSNSISIELGVYLLVIFFSIFKFIKLDPSTLLRKKGFKRYIKSIYKVGYIAILDGILWKLVPIYFINQLCTNTEKAVYLLTILIGNAATLIPLSFIESWIREFADTYRKNADEFLVIFANKRKKIGYTILIIIPIAVFGLSFLMNTLYIKYISFLWVIIIFVPLRIIVSFFDIYSVAIYATHNENKLIVPATLGALVLVILSFSCSNYYGLVGVLAAYIISKFFVALLTYKAFRNSFKIAKFKV